MKHIKVILILAAMVLGAAAVANAQSGQTFTGTIVSYGSRAYTGLRTGNFTLTVNSWTPEDKAQRFLGLLQESGQDRLLDAIKHEDVGSFSVNNGLSRTVNVARQTNANGKILIRAVFERWEQFAEIRGGYRSLDYPFGYIELTIDPVTGKGTGQYFAAAKIHWKDDKKNGWHIEVEDYATFPARLTNVKAGRR